MTTRKAKAAAKTAAAPAAPPPPSADPVNPVHDEAGAPPPDDRLTQDASVVANLVPKAAPLVADFKHLAHVRNLPEVPADEEVDEIAFAPGSIERFKASETDRRTMEVVACRGGFAVRAVAEA